MFLGAPVINFNGEILVDSLEIGFVQVNNQKYNALRITIQQVNSYQVLASQGKYYEILAYCEIARQKKIQRMSAYTPCVVMQSNGKQVIPLVTHITWYIPKDLHNQAQREIAKLQQSKDRHRQFPHTEQVFAEFTSWQR